MRDIGDQIRAYAQSLDAEAPSLDEIVAASEDPRSAAGIRRVPSWLAVAGAAVAAVLVVGSATALIALRQPTDGTAGTSIPTSSVATSTVDVPTSVGSPGLAPSPYVSLVSDVPVYSGGEAGDVGGLPAVDAGPIYVSDGVYHTLFAAGGEDEVWDAVYHATSPDGSAWTVDPEPVAMPGVEGAASLVVGSLDQLDDGLWVTYFHVAFDVGGHGNHLYEFAIRRATAAVPGGPWTVDPNPVLLPGNETDWDGGSVKYPSVVRTNSGWVMFYAGYPSGPETKESMASGLGYAVSEDGVTWKRDAEPVFIGEGESWDQGSVSRVTVSLVDDRFVVLYSGRTGGSRGAAVSGDGRSWTRIGDGPILTALDVPRPSIFTVSLFDDGEVARLYVSNGGYRSSSAVYEMELLLPDG